MLEPPTLPEMQITACLQQSYGLQVEALTFLPLGADVNTAVYCACTPAGDYFVKLRRGGFDPLAVTLPAFLAEQGLGAVIAPLPNHLGSLWTELEAYRLVLYPFIAGQDGYQVRLSEAQWRAFGAALRQVHQSELPAELLRQVPRERYDPAWRERVRAFQAQVETETFDEPVAAQLAAFMRQKRAEIEALLAQAERLALALQTHPPEFVLCHSDLHAGNLHLTSGGRLFIVDWDNPILAPKEHDLMHIGASARWGSRQVKRLFFQGYGPAQLNGPAIAYYRSERILRDIAEFCTQLLASSEGGADREQSLGYFTGQFEAGQEVEIALRGSRGEKMQVPVCFRPRGEAGIRQSRTNR